MMLPALSFNNANTQDWSIRIDAYADGHTYCIIGEKDAALDGVDQYDVPEPPFEPPGRAFIFLSEQSFPDPHNRLWYEFKKYSDTHKEWNLTTFYIPMDNQGINVTLTWNHTETEYNSILIYRDGVVVADMLTNDSLVFWSDPYQMTHFIIVFSVETPNTHPTTPTITGTHEGKPHIAYPFSFSTTDPDNDTVSYLVDWGDGSNSSWTSPYPSGINVTMLHTWSVKGAYSIRCRAKDAHGAGSEWGIFPVTVQKNFIDIVKEIYHQHHFFIR